MQERPAEEEHLALMGPLIRAEVGDRVVVHLKNELPFSISFEPQGLLADKEVYKVVAEPKATVVYTFGVPEQVNSRLYPILSLACNSCSIICCFARPMLCR